MTVSELIDGALDVAEPLLDIATKCSFAIAPFESAAVTVFFGVVQEFLSAFDPSQFYCLIIFFRVKNYSQPTIFIKCVFLYINYHSSPLLCSVLSNIKNLF